MIMVISVVVVVQLVYFVEFEGMLVITIEMVQDMVVVIVWNRIRWAYYHSGIPAIFAARDCFWIYYGAYAYQGIRGLQQ